MKLLGLPISNSHGPALSANMCYWYEAINGDFYITLTTMPQPRR